MKRTCYNFLLLCCIIVFLPACDKGYRVRFTNYYAEPIDSVIIGSNRLIFAGIARDSTTDFNKISQGKHSVLIISKTKKRFSTDLEIPKSGSGDRTIQIDGINQVSILEE